jgi:hypothetical protein
MNTSARKGTVKFILTYCHFRAVGLRRDYPRKPQEAQEEGDAGTIYFTAGPNDETDGLFGSLTPAAPGTPCGIPCR